MKNNSIKQLIQKGDINKEQLLNHVAEMIFPEQKPIITPDNKSVQKQMSDSPIVLIVEDNQDNMFTIKVLLGDKCKIIEAQDGPSGIAMAQLHQPHLILMDIALPGMNGIEVLKELRREKTTLHIPVIAVSANAMKGDHEDFIAQGFNEYISKPIDIKRFENVIEQWIGK